MKRTILGLAAATLLAVSSLSAHAGGKGSDWTGTALNGGQVNNSGVITNPKLNYTINSGAANVATGANAAASFNTLSGSIPNLGNTSIGLSSVNHGQVNNSGVITNPQASVSYGASFVNGATGASTQFSQNSIGAGFLTR